MRCHEGNVLRSGCALTELQEVVTDDTQITAELQRNLQRGSGETGTSCGSVRTRSSRCRRSGLLVSADSTFVRDWLRRNFADDVADMLQSNYWSGFPGRV